MGWGLHRSKKLPLGFRLNVSKSGVGYSWGWGGFRIGKDARGRTVRTVSIPGTGISRRDYVAAGREGQAAGDRRRGLWLGLVVVSLLAGAVCGSAGVGVFVLVFGAVAIAIGGNRRS